MKAYCLLNHVLTDNQINELSTSYNCNEIEYANQTISQIWSQLPPQKNIDISIINKITQWLENAVENDVLIIQGEFGYTFALVDYALGRKLIPVHAVTKRVAQEQRNGEIVERKYIFEHVCFRKYNYYIKRVKND